MIFFDLKSFEHEHLVKKINLVCKNYSHFLKRANLIIFFISVLDFFLRSLSFSTIIK